MLGNFSTRIREIKRAALLREYPGAYSPSWEIAEKVANFMPSIAWVGGSEREKIKTESGLPGEIESAFESFLELFRSLYVRWNDKGDASLFAYYGPAKGARHVLLAQWSIGHDPPDLSLLPTEKPSRTNSVGVWLEKIFSHCVLLRSFPASIG